MVDGTATKPRLAPLDPFVIDFLGWVGDQTEGYAPSADRASVAGAFEWPIPFVDVVFTSARVRRLLAPAQSFGRRGRVRWNVSDGGRDWLAQVVSVGVSLDLPAPRP